jgi:hypothetical protein
VVVGMFGLSSLFSDLSPGESDFRRGLFTVLAYLVGGVAIGWLLRRRWYLAIAEAWGPALDGVMVAFVSVRMGVTGPRVLYAVLGLCVFPLLSLLAGFVGSRLVRHNAVTPVQAN